MQSTSLPAGLPEPDGCTGWIDGVWRHCCDAHDIAYSSGFDKFQTDLELAVCVAQTGNPIVAVLMFLGVTIFGWFWYLKAKRTK